VSKKKILQGVSASPGRVRGKVKIVLNPSGISKMREGNILVTEMTNPLFVPAMEKARAIVTDVGGQLSHAAIVSRELGIPCIVATQKATKVLKDGMEIVVDASEGVVYGA